MLYIPNQHHILLGFAIKYTIVNVDCFNIIKIRQYCQYNIINMMCIGIISENCSHKMKGVSQGNFSFICFLFFAFRFSFFFFLPSFEFLLLAAFPFHNFSHRIFTREMFFLLFLLFVSLI